MDILEFRARVLVIQAARGPLLPVSSGDRAIRLSWAVLETHGPAGSGGRLPVIRQPRRGGSGGGRRRGVADRPTRARDRW